MPVGLAPSRASRDDVLVTSIDGIIDHSRDAWSSVVSNIAKAAGHVDVVPSDPEPANRTVRALGASTKSTIAAIAYHTGGIKVDRGWLRILGSGSSRFGNGLVDWNESLGGRELDPPAGNAILIAYDAVGGFFLLDRGRWNTRGEVFYMGPDSSGWQGLTMSYSGFIDWALSRSAADFYSHLRWTGWEREVEPLGPDQGLLIYPPPGFAGPELSDRSRGVVPARELWTFVHQLSTIPTATPTKVSIVEDQKR